MEQTKRCIECGEVKPVGEFYKQTHPAKDGSIRYLSSCRECWKKRTSVSTKQWRQSHKAQAAKYAREWYANNKELARLYDRHTRLRNVEHYRQKDREYRAKDPSRYRLYDLAKIAARYSFNRSMKDVRSAISETLESYRVGDQYWDVYESRLIDKPTIDHIVPIARGGGSTVENLCVTSLSNNSSKHKKPLLVWLTERAVVERLVA